MKTTREHKFIANCPAMERLMKLIPPVEESDIPVFLSGPSGSGKDVIARQIHERSSRKGKPFLSINCAALPESLLESELFGHRKGSFTGADRDHKGLFERANGGTLFLNEIGDATLPIQAKLLQATEGELRQVGGNEIIAVDVRIITATHCSLLDMVAEKLFRRDLFHRLVKLPLGVPPLCERGDDIIAIAEDIVDALPRRYCLTPEAKTILLRHDWPGNIRELENVIHRAAIYAEIGVVRREGDLVPITEEHITLDIALRDHSGAAGTVEVDQELNLLRFTIPILPGLIDPMLYSRTVDECERALLTHVLNVVQGNQSAAALMLGISRSTLKTKMVKLGITLNQRVG